MSGPAERMPGEERDLAGPRAIPAGHLADIGAKFAEVRAAVVELHAAQARELDRRFGTRSWRWNWPPATIDRPRSARYSTS